MAKAAISDYSTTAASNSDIDGLDSAGATGLVKSGDNYVRSLMAHAKANANDLGAVNTVAGSGDAITVTLAASPTSLVDGYRFVFSASAINTGAVTIAVTNGAAASLGTKKIRKWVAGVETALSAGDIAGAGTLVEVIYDTARDTAAGAFMLANVASSVSAATTSAAGIVELATQTEAATLTDTSRAITSDGLFFLGGYTTTATAAGTTTLTVTSNYSQVFTGTTTQTVVLPVTSTLVLGRRFRIVNNSTGLVTVQSSGANTIQIMGGTGITYAPGAPGTELIVTCISTSGTGTSSWAFEYLPPTTNWVSYTPTFTNFGTVTSISMWSRRVGDTLEVEGRGTSGTVVASELRMTLGYNGADGGVTADATKISAITVLGSWVQNTVAPGTILVESGSAYCTFGASGAPATKATGSSASNTTVQHVKFAVPITGW